MIWTARGLSAESLSFKVNTEKFLGETRFETQTIGLRPDALPTELYAHVINYDSKHDIVSYYMMNVLMEFIFRALDGNLIK